MKATKFMHSTHWRLFELEILELFLILETNCMHKHNFTNTIFFSIIIFFSRCKSEVYPQKLPDVSIVICFYNEHFHTLRRSVQSVLDRTPLDLIREIILVNDYSDVPNLHEDVDDYVKNLKNVNNKTLNKTINKNVLVTLLKTERREGLIRARLFGAEKSHGQVL